MKTKKFIETLGAIGKVAATPVIAAGKFVVSNWYTLLQLYKGPYQEYKKRQEIENNNEVKQQNEVFTEKQQNVQEKNEQTEDDTKTDADNKTTNESQKVNEIKSDQKVENQDNNQQKVEENKSPDTKTETKQEIKVEIDPNKKNLCMIEDEIKLPKTIMKFYQMTDVDRERMYDAYRNGQISPAMWPDFLSKPDESLQNFPQLSPDFNKNTNKNKEVNPEPVQENIPEVVTPKNSSSKGYYTLTPVGPIFLTDDMFNVNDYIAETEPPVSDVHGGGAHR